MSELFLDSMIVPLSVDEVRSPTLGTDRPEESAFTHRCQHLAEAFDPPAGRR